MHKYHLNPEQQELLAEVVKELGLRLLNIDFDDPATDDKMIRHHAYLRGKFQLASEILRDEFPEPEAPEATSTLN